MENFVYFIGSAICLFFWLLFFLLKKYLRKEMLFMGFLFALLGPFQEYFFFKDYWRPFLIFKLQLGNLIIAVEDVILGFALGGLAAVVYEFFLGKKFIRRGRINYQDLFIIIIIWFSCLFLLTKFLGLNSIFAVMIGYLINAIVIYFRRKDLILNIFLSGLFTGVGVLIFYLIYTKFFPDYIEKVWLLKNTRMGILVLGVPLTEILWAFSIGTILGPIYEFIMNFKQKKTNG